MSAEQTTRSELPRISVLVCTRNRSHAILGCLQSILASEMQDMELLVIDQSTDSRTRDEVSKVESDKRLRYIGTSTKGLSRARNIGIRESRAPLILFTDDDNFAEADWIERVVEEFDANQDIDAVYGRVLPYADNPNAGSEGWHCPTTMEKAERHFVRTLTKSTHEALGHGNNMAFRRSVFERYGLYMEWLGAGTWMTGGEDTDFTFRILRKGVQMLYSPLPTVHHDNWMPIEKSNAQLYGYMFSAAVVFTRHFLHGSLTAGRVQMRFFRQYWSDFWGSVKWRNKRAVRHHGKLMRGWVSGAFFGLLNVFRRVPRYAPNRS